MSAGHAADYISDLRALIGDHPLNLMGAAAILLDAEGRVLLQKLAYRDVWGLPGGLCELAEAPEDTLRREVFEETALTVHAAQLLTLLTTPLRTLPNGHQAAFYTALYLVTGWEGEPVADGVESGELRFFAAHELPAPLRGVAGQWAADWLKPRM
ncbi:NUDIX domain-containing protein [Deinococcus cavernae]|uniref:NUDIX domain-containing protein n=2 Tax=Deinococcus cavernae TaxID=2320857 RepID=A0A418V7B8_9DEIO|nr:NUDIX domain-containing protein [Deinococcus cavernae]